MLALSPDWRSSAASMAFRSYLWVPGRGFGIIPLRTQFRKAETVLHPAYAAAASTVRHRGGSITLKSSCLELTQLFLKLSRVGQARSGGRGSRGCRASPMGDQPSRSRLLDWPLECWRRFRGDIGALASSLRP